MKNFSVDWVDTAIITFLKSPWDLTPERIAYNWH